MNKPGHEHEYDLAVIGGGAAGLVSTGFASKLGLKVVVISDGPPGGECLWSGCVPSKALIASAHSAQILRESPQYGISYQPQNLDFLQVMARMKKLRARISHHDSQETVEAYGAKVILGRASFLSPHAISVNGEAIITARKFIIATGANQRLPAIEGLAEVGCLTHESILNLKEQPQHLIILGGGPVGVEYSQTFARLGTKVTLIQIQERLLMREEPESSLLILERLKNEGVEVLLSHQAIKAEKMGKKIALTLSAKNDTGTETRAITCDAIMASTGKRANTETLNLSACDVELDDQFIKVNERQRTTTKNIWACGDVCKGYQFTHYADHQARIAVINACLRLPVKREKKVIPWCTFSDPEIASVGLREKEAEEQYSREKIIVLRYNLDDFDRAIVDGADRGFVKITALKQGTILGASIVGKSAGELIHEIALAMKKNIKVQELASLIHVYPTMSCAIANTTGGYYKTAATQGWQAKLLRHWVQFIK